MPGYLIRHTKGQHGDVLIEDDGLAVSFTEGWACFTDQAGALAFAIPAAQVASIQRVDDDQEPAPEAQAEE